MNLTKRALMTGAAMALGLAASGAPVLAESHSEKTKVGFVYVGPVGDGGWTYEHDQGRKAVEEHFGDAVETVYVENVPEGPDAERVMVQMARDGADLIFTTSFGYMDPTINVASKFPDVKFEHATGYKTADNVSVYSARFYEGRAVQGHIAGSMTESNIIGYIGSYPIPEVIRGINSAYIHAKKVNPDVEFKIVWAFTWFDPAKEADAAKVLIEQGADVILQHTDSTAPLAAAQEAGGIIGFGQASDMAEYAPSPRVSSIIDNWAPYYIARTQAVMDGTWESSNTWDGIGPGMVGIGEITDAVPEDVKAEALALKESIASGDYHPFTGPLKKQDGSDWLAEGETADDGTLAGMNFFVEGLEGEIPQ
ncbi:MAG: BMP family ABC transporter substrate-binding protein [Pseudooceanicola atlanticus]